jgi:CheY-like chemotaxis protein
MSAFARKRILIVEDEAIVADMLQMMLEDLDIVPVGPAGTVAQALSYATNEMLDAAILDVNLRGQKIDPVADALRERKVPLLFATGYGEGAAEAAQGAPILAKPYTRERLTAALALCLAPATDRPASG